MLAKKFRFRIQDQKIGQGQKLKVWKSNQYFIIKTSLNNLPYSRFGVTVGRSVYQRASRRNQVKRTILNFIRLNELHRMPGKNVLIITRPPVDQLTKTKIQQELNKIFAPAIYG